MWYVDVKNGVYVNSVENVGTTLTVLKNNVDYYGKVVNPAKVVINNSGYSVAEVTSGNKPLRDFFQFNMDGSVNYTDAKGTSHYWSRIADVVWPIVQKSKYVGKIVKFKYNGGTNWGGVRIVKVTSETSDSFYGTDLEKGETRQYINSRINGIIEILN